MAITVCLGCDAYRLDNQDCPECLTPDYLSDDDPVIYGKAVDVFIEQVVNDQEKLRRHKLKELDTLRPKHWWKRLIKSFLQYV